MFDPFAEVRLSPDSGDRADIPRPQLRATSGSRGIVLGRSHVLPIVAEFQCAFPYIRMRLQLRDRYVNLVEEHVDLAVRIGGLPDSSIIVTRPGLIRRVVCASPAYLKAHGVPKEPADLASHDCVTYDPGTPWEFRRNGATQTVDSRLAVNLGGVAAAAAVAGAGISRVLSYLIEDLLKSRSLVTLLDAYEPSPFPVSVIYPSQRHVPLKIRAFLDFAVPRLRKRFCFKNS